MVQSKKEIVEKYNISEEDQIILGLIRAPMLSGRVRSKEKDDLQTICLKKRSTQSEEIRNEIEKFLRKKNINWENIKLQRGESLKKKPTTPVRIRVKGETEESVRDLCEMNSVTVSSFVRFVITKYIEKNKVYLDKVEDKK